MKILFFLNIKFLLGKKLIIIIWLSNTGVVILVTFYIYIEIIWFCTQKDNVVTNI